MKTAAAGPAVLADKLANINASGRTAVFILSSGQSGSTWAGYVLGNHVESAFLGEYSRAWNGALRVPCTICSARGLTRCEVLGALEEEPAERAFHLAFERTGKRVVIDTSKDVDWVRLFRGGSNIDIRMIHLVRDPRGFLASVRRRVPVDVDSLIGEWCNENKRLRDFAETAGLKSITASYDSLASSPETEFPRLFNLCSMTFTKDSLNYWETEHHGFAANGASDAILKGKNYGHMPSHFRTGDAEFYAQKSQTSFHDLRWRQAITRDEAASIENNSNVQDLLASLGFALTQEGMRALPQSAFSSTAYKRK